MTKPNYYDSLNTTERMTHSALLERHDTVAAKLDALANQFAELQRQNAQQIETMCAYVTSLWWPARYDG